MNTLAVSALKDLFVGTKLVLATAMTRQQYNDYRGWQVPADENPADEGYLVEYTNGGAPNHPDHAGYVSWSPKAQFDEANLSLGAISHLAPHLQRLIAEHAQLLQNFTKLESFTRGEVFLDLPEDDRELLIDQLRAQKQLLSILEARVVRGLAKVSADALGVNLPSLAPEPDTECDEDADDLPGDEPTENEPGDDDPEAEAKDNWLERLLDSGRTLVRVVVDPADPTPETTVEFAISEFHRTKPEAAADGYVVVVDRASTQPTAPESDPAQ